MDAYLLELQQFFQSYWWSGIVVAVAAYLLGSINPAVIVTKIATKGELDIRSVGSGNAGFTNVLRAVGKVPAVITLVCDALKCVIAVLLGGILFSQLIAGRTDLDPVMQLQIINVGKYIAGIFCILGHSFPIYFRFKGGKGVVSAAALMLTEDWRVFLMILATFLLMFIFSKIISLASITCALLYGPYTFIATYFFDLRGNTAYFFSYVLLSTIAALIIGIFVTIKHKENIKRLLRGEEKKIHAKK